MIPATDYLGDGCGEPTPAAVEVYVMDSLTTRPVDAPFAIIVTKGSKTQVKAVHEADFVPGSGVRAAEWWTGPLTVRVEKAGYAPWQGSVTVQFGSCRPVTEVMLARLVR